MVILERKVIDYLNEKLLLPFDNLVQDWDIEMADSSRINEFIDFYKNNSLSLEEKKGLMSLIIASFDDYLNEIETDSSDIWDQVSVLIKQEIEIFYDLIHYWSNDRDEESSFKVSKYLIMLLSNNISSLK